MGSIVLLDENTINKIAAGEVVDRPASIVKELVENSIDAKAKNITVEIKRGGIDYIRVTDDGCGFKSDDVELAFERHATSKIRKEADILKITSMGFRGEALASIAAISKVTLTTRHIDENLGSKIVIEGGNIVSFGVAPSNVGSSIVIKDVFYNTPARYKFLKKDYTEAGYIEDSVIRIALSNPNVAIKLISSGKTIVSTSGDGIIQNAVYSIFGKDIYSNILSLDYDYQDIKVEGVIGLPSISRSSRNNEFTFINSRYVKDKTLTSAIEKGYEEKLMINKFPFCILNVKMNPESLDVNVHPAKLEVKFENENKVFEAVYYAVKNVLEQNSKENSPFTILKEKAEDVFEKAAVLEEKTQTENDNQVLENDSKEAILEEYKIANENENKYEEYVKKDELTTKDDNFSLNEEQKPVYEVKSEAIIEDKEYVKDEVYTQEDIIKEASSRPLYKYVGCAFNTYIMIEMDSKLYFIDQHAAHERYLYDKVKKYFEEKDKDSQMLLVPIIVDLRQNEMETVKENKEYFEKYGFIFEEFSKNSYKISGVPNIGDIKIDYKDMFLDIIDEFMTGNKTQRNANEFRFLATIACKAAVKGNIAITPEEQIKLIDGMLISNTPFTCPHGRPTAFSMTRYELEKKFGRIQ